MSFVSYDKFKEKAMKGPGVKLNSLFKIGDIIDSRIVEEFCDVIKPSCKSGTILQLSEAYVYAKDMDGVSRPCYVTFSYDGNDWLFCGVCFENSAINRSDEFEHAKLSVGDFCVDKFYCEYVRSIQNMYNDEQNGVNISDFSVIYDYMNFNSFVMAGYLISAKNDGREQEVINGFLNSKSDDTLVELYNPVIKLLENKDKSIDAIFWNKKKHNKEKANSIDELISSATQRSKDSGSENHKSNKVKDVELINDYA